MSHHNSYYSNDDADLASPIAAHHSSIASSTLHPRQAAQRSVNVSATQSQSMRRQQEELSMIQAEIESLKERRRQLEVQRKFAIAANAPTVSAAGRPGSSRASSSHTRAASQNTSGMDGPTERLNKSTGGPLPTSSRQLHPYSSEVRYDDQPQVARSQPRRSRSQVIEPSMIAKPLDHTAFIPAEKLRREKVNASHNPYRDMKEAMKASWQSDTTLLGGYFLVQDNPKVGTFGRARRFTQLQGREEQYYLGTNVQLLQERARSSSRPHFSVSNRGKSGCNINSNWNDPRGGVAPGPGAYTPRYQKLAAPSILTQK